MDLLGYTHRGFPGYELMMAVMAKALYEDSKVPNSNIDNESIEI